MNHQQTQERISVRRPNLWTWDGSVKRAPSAAALAQSPVKRFLPFRNIYFSLQIEREKLRFVNSLGGGDFWGPAILVCANWREWE